MYTIQVVGAGYTGLRIAKFFAEKKQKVFALTRSPEKAAALQKENIQPLVADLTKPETLSGIPPAHFIVLCPAPDESTEAAYEAVYLRGIGNYLNAIRKNPRPLLIVQLSSTGVWQDQTGDWLDENSEPVPRSPKARILCEAERQVLGCGLPAAIFRLAGIYGPGRNRLWSFREGKWPEANADRWLNLIHVDDIAQALPLFFKNAKEGEVFLGVDDEPVRISALYEWLCRETGRAPEKKFSIFENTKRYKNGKLKTLGVRLKYPTFRDAYSEWLCAEKPEKA